MQLRDAAIATSFGRAALGASLLLAPKRIATAWVGSGDDAAALLTRAVGVRDLALGAGCALSLIGEDDAAAGWLAAASICDVGDVAATLIAGKSLPRSGTLGVLALAVPSAALMAAAARSVRS